MKVQTESDRLEVESRETFCRRVPRPNKEGGSQSEVGIRCRDYSVRANRGSPIAFYKKNYANDTGGMRRKCR